MHVLVGLGNPGKAYEETRHNIGFQVIDALVGHLGLAGPQVKYQGEFFQAIINGEKLIAFKPLTYMNHTGAAVAEVVKFYKLPLDRLVVFHDDIDLPLGKIKAKQGGGHGGHNGLRDIDDKLGNHYIRVRLGIGHPGVKEKVSHHVLSAFTAVESSIVEQLIHGIVTHYAFLLKNDLPSFLMKVKS